MYLCIILHVFISLFNFGVVSNLSCNEDVSLWTCRCWSWSWRRSGASRISSFVSWTSWSRKEPCTCCSSASLWVRATVTNFILECSLMAELTFKFQSVSLLALKGQQEWRVYHFHSPNCSFSDPTLIMFTQEIISGRIVGDWWSICPCDINISGHSWLSLLLYPPEEFNDKILSPELGDSELQRLHGEVVHIYETYCLDESIDKISFDKFIVEEIRNSKRTWCSLPNCQCSCESLHSKKLKKSLTLSILISWGFSTPHSST